MTTSTSPRSHGVRSGTAALAALALAGVSLWGASAAFAVEGDSGEIKIHKSGTRAADTKDHYEVCTFNLSATNFETVKMVNWTVTPPQPKTPVEPILSGGLVLMNGKGSTADYSLPDGHYQLSWTFPGGVPKQKIFKVNCAKKQDDKPAPRGAVPAGGGGAADIGTGTGTGTETDDGASAGLAPALVAGAAGVAGLMFVRRARRRANGAA
ncbi:hypothetical protein J7E91_15500 [Streptomyces sp. ISL-99]|uniref:hypothetical protein n=1 Tax=Streptomyces sp. ISL-99 TaxID=2819193 RepID=UPI001BEA4E83|nr:hypothetical protein [Streptomyces sp. ISL-99]MBT2526793.1 hypothetical protein [Streptomyces sp. ISL-99]